MMFVTSSYMMQRTKDCRLGHCKEVNHTQPFHVFMISLFAAILTKFFRCNSRTKFPIKIKLDKDRLIFSHVQVASFFLKN
jgi:hypothetical protein